MAVQGKMFFYLLFLIESGILRQMFGSLLRKAQYSSLDLSESQQENAEDSGKDPNICRNIPDSIKNSK
jgi:hypothetical protein